MAQLKRTGRSKSYRHKTRKKGEKKSGKQQLEDDNYIKCHKCGAQDYQAIDCSRRKQLRSGAKSTKRIEERSILNSILNCS